jgi:hypothetical protein
MFADVHRADHLVCLGVQIEPRYGRREECWVVKPPSGPGDWVVDMYCAENEEICYGPNTHGADCDSSDEIPLWHSDGNGSCDLCWIIATGTAVKDDPGKGNGPVLSPQSLRKLSRCLCAGIGEGMKHGLLSASWQMLCNDLASGFETFLLRRLRSARAGPLDWPQKQRGLY